jgi:hypothetical protein
MHVCVAFSLCPSPVGHLWLSFSGCCSSCVLQGGLVSHIPGCDLGQVSASKLALVPSFLPCVVVVRNPVKTQVVGS